MGATAAQPPAVVARLRRSRGTAAGSPRAARTHREPLLGVGPFRARCLFTSMVLFRMLRDQGDDAELGIGLPLEPKDKDAHAWVGSAAATSAPPGRGRHEELARYA